jgi:hypothetical protein
MSKRYACSASRCNKLYAIIDPLHFDKTPHLGAWHDFVIALARRAIFFTFYLFFTLSIVAHSLTHSITHTLDQTRAA